MSADATGEPTPADQTAPAQPEKPTYLGALATFRQTPTPAKALLAGVFVNRLAGFLLIFLVLFLTDRGFSPGQAGLALGVYGAGGVLGTFVGGWLSDRMTARATTLVSMVGTALLLVSILYLESYPLILLAVVLLSIVGVLYRPAAQSMITELVPQSQLVMVTAMYRLCLNLGTTAAPLIGVALVSISYDLLFWAEAMAALVYGLIALRYLPKREPATEASQAAAATEPRGGYLAVFSDVRYVFYLAAVLLVMLVYIQYTAALPLAIEEAGQSLWWYGAVVALNAAVVVLLEVPLTKYVQSWPIRLVALVGFGSIAVGYTVYAFGITPALLVLGTLIWTANELIGGPTTFAWPGLVAPAHLRGRYYGAMQSAIGLGMTVGPVAGVALWDALGQTFFLWAAGVGVLSAICAVIGMQKPAAAAAAEAPEPTTAPAVAEPPATEPETKKEVHHGS
jgi:MFS family permease